MISNEKQNVNLNFNVQKIISVDPTGPWQYNFTSYRGQPLYNSIATKLAGPEVSII